MPSAMPTAVSGGVRVLVQLSDELTQNGTAMWRTRAGMHYQARDRAPLASCIMLACMFRDYRLLRSFVPMLVCSHQSRSSAARRCGATAGGNAACRCDHP
jgi:hypothetical protein